MSTHPEHDHDALESKRNLARAVRDAYGPDRPTCQHCDVDARPIPGPGTAWDVEVHHERRCPQHEDNRPALELHTNGGIEDLRNYLALEHAWRADAHDPGPDLGPGSETW